MLCKKCKTPLKLKGTYMVGMFVDWWECPKCDENEEPDIENKEEKNDGSL